MAINHVMSNWYRNYPLGFIINLNRKVSKIINGRNYLKDLTKEKYLGDLYFFISITSRVYIPKDNKKFRPLGVPRPEWRILLHMYSNFLTYFLQTDMPHQHGFLPRKGTLTAWKDIFNKRLVEKKFIKEWDFKNYFNTLKTVRITEILIERGVPRNVAIFLQNINLSDVTLPRAGSWTPETSEEQAMIREELRAKTHKDLDMMAMEMGSLEPEVVLDRMKGVAQGSPTSPILANLIMDLWIKEHKTSNAEIVAYADDSVSFSNQEINIAIPENTGIVINESKSGYVKYDGEWKKPLKFLGLEYDGKYFKANTRKGSQLRMTDKQKLLMEVQDKLVQDMKFTNIEEAIQFLESKNISTEHFGPSGQTKIRGNW